MKTALEDFLQAQIRAPWPERLIEGTRRIEVRKPLIFRNVDYRGPDPRVAGAPGELLEVPVAAAKEFYRAGKIWIISDGRDRATGQWDVYQVKGALGYRPWDEEPNEPHVPQMTPTEYDDLWCPVKECTAGGSGPYGPILYLPYRLVQRLPLSTDPKAEFSAMQICLPFEDSMRPRMVSV
jgi:hypothetical protein